MSFPSKIEIRKNSQLHFIRVDDVVIHLAGDGVPDESRFFPKVDDVVLHLTSGETLTLHFTDSATDTKELTATSTTETELMAQGDEADHAFLINESFIFFDYHILRVFGKEIEIVATDDSTNPEEIEKTKGVWEFATEKINKLVIVPSTDVVNQTELRVYLETPDRNE